MKHYSSYLYHIQASHSTITSYKQQGRESEWQRMGGPRHTLKIIEDPKQFLLIRVILVVTTFKVKTETF